jgi:hypothetical protein
LNSEPIQGLEGPQSSVEIDPVYDNHQIEFEICRKWVISEEGRIAKIDNNPGYMNVLLHGYAHFQEIQQAQMAQAQAQSPNAGPPDKSGNVPPRKSRQTEQEAPIMGDSNVPTIQ